MKKKIVSVLMAFTMLISCIGIQPIQAEADATKKSETAVMEERTNVLNDTGKLLNNVSVEGTNSFGNMLAAEFADKTEEIEDGNGFFISAIEMEGTEATVSLEAIEDCTLVVAVYDEAGEEMLAVGSGEVTAGEREAVVTIETENMPEYFYLMGYLIDTDTLRPLCSVFESPNYTREMQEFLKKTTEDFDESKVVNLDDDITTNFLVCEEDTRKLSGNGETNRIVSVNEEMNTYVIENADSSITSLKQGDSFVYPYAEGEILAGKIAEITVSGTTVTIVCEETSLEEIFEYVRIEGESLSQEAEVNEESIGEGFTYQGVSKEQEVQGQYYGPNVQGVQGTAKGVDIGDKVSNLQNFGINCKVAGEEGTVAVTGSLSLGIDASVKLLVTISHKSLELKLDYKGEVEIDIEGSIASIEKDIAEFKFTPVPGVNIVLKPRFLFSASVKLSFTAEIGGTIGFRVTKKGMENITTIPTAKADVEIEASVYIGFALVPAIEIVDDWLANAEIEAAIGAEIKGTLASLGTEQVDDKRHTCKVCVDGEINGKLDVAFKASLLEMEFKKKLLGKEKKITDFYYSFDYGEFAFTTCPHYEYKVNVQVNDKKGQPVSGANITIGKDTYTTDESGGLTFWRPSGNFELIAEKEGFLKTKEKCIMRKRGKRVVVVLEKENGDADDFKDDRGIIKSVSLGRYHSAVITEDGSLYMWGRNNYGQVGDGTTEDRLMPTKILENVRSVSLGENYSGAITEDGSLYMWGHNVYGEVGDGTTGERLMPTKILENVRSVSLGENHSGAITEDGSLYMWGRNNYGQVGDGTMENKLMPTRILDNMRSVCLEGDDSGAITEDGSLYMWGSNYGGQVGDGTTENRVVPTKILENVSSVSLGENHSGAITEDGSLYMWGNNSEGQVGDRTTKNNPVPTKVLENVSSVSLTDYQSGAITEDGSLYMWGSRIYQRWDGNMASTASSIPEKELNNVKSVSLGLASYYYGAIVEDGSLYMWGEGYVGDGTTEMREVPTKVLDNVRSMSLGSGFSGAITEDGSLYMWGRNRYGQLGDGTTENKLVPTRIPFPPESTTYNSPAKNSGFKILNPVFSAKREREEQAMPSASKTFTDLKPEATYNFYIMESKEAEDKFSSENLLYIKQAKADSEGVLRMEYPSNVSVSDAEAFVVCAKQDNIANAQITAKTASYNGKEQFADVTVIYNGKTLEEGKDYEIEGSFSATEAGTYSVTVTGIGVYTGEKTIDWEIKQTGQIENKLGDVNKDGKINSEDALAVLKYDVRIAQEIFVEEAADVNKDGKVNSEDALDILKHDVKLLQIS